mmetsp:Transcript_18354/g.28181  ORF Transcript_18354/g.28181 Transcript_18354/m.28181 type:complete len:85 (+) Transcript_18354:154-408(+)
MINDPQLHIVLAVLNIDVADLHDKKVEHFMAEEDIPEDLAKVRQEYHRQRRKTKLFQLENAVNGNSENVFMSAGLNLHNVQALA